MMSARDVIPGSSGFPVRWSGGFAVVKLPSGRDALMRAARRAHGWGSWLRLVVPDPGVRRVLRLVTLDEVMPVHASVTGAIVAAREAAMVGGRR